jgi:hypothetical protein
LLLRVQQAVAYFVGAPASSDGKRSEDVWICLLDDDLQL